MPRQASGSVTRKKTAAAPIPSTRAACSSCASTFSKAARADLQTNGKATIAAAITAPCQVKMRLMPNVRSSQPPSQPRRPITTSR
jgi:hypothetical protein